MIMKLHVTLAVTLSFGQYVQAAPKPCSNQGLQWAVQSDNTDFITQSDYTNYDPAAVKTKKPLSNGTTPYLFVYEDPISKSNPNGNPIYSNNFTGPETYFVLNHRGYLYTETAGTYTFNASLVDDIVYTWLGDKAYSGWNKTNYNTWVPLNFTQRSGGQGSYKVNLAASRYYPLRILFKQGDGHAQFNYTIADPKGNILINSNAKAAANPNIVQFSCDKTTAPPYQPYGMES